VSERIYLSSPDVTEAEERAVVRALRSGWVAPLGPEVDAFEAELAAYCERDHCVALSSGTAALHLGLLTLGVRPGDLVLTSTITRAKPQWKIAQSHRDGVASMPLQRITVPTLIVSHNKDGCDITPAADAPVR